MRETAGRLESLSKPSYLSAWTRREFMIESGKLAIAVALGMGGLNSLLGCQGSPTTSSAQLTTVKLGIFGGSQTLWRYMASKKEELLRPRGYEASFIRFPSEAALRDAFSNKDIDVIATLPTIVPSFVKDGRQVQYFLPIAWIDEGYPLIADVNAVIHTIPNLAGRKVATLPLDHPGFAYWRAFVLKNYGFRIEDGLQLIEMQAPEQALIGGLVDAAIVDSSVWSQLKPSGRFSAISDLRSEWSRIRGSDRPLMFGGYMADSAWIKQNANFVRDFIQLNSEALRLYKSSKDSVLVPASTYNDGNESAMPKDVHQFIATYLGYDTVGPERVHVDNDDIQDYKLVYQLLYESGFLTQNPQSVENLFYLGGR